MNKTSKAVGAKMRVAEESVEQPLLHPLLTNKSALTAEYRKRNSPYLFRSEHSADQEALIAQGWELHGRPKANQKSVKLRRLKPHHQALEDKTWCLFYRMGYPELNAPNFNIGYERYGAEPGRKQVDVFAKDNETVIVVECKSREARSRRTLQKDIHETDALQGAFSASIKKHYGGSFKPKIIWVYVTHNIIWSEEDLERARAANIRMVTENEFNYFDAFIRHMGPAGRYQFLAEFLAGQQIPGLSNIRVPAVRGTLGKHTFYNFVTTPRQLLKIAYVNHLALNHPDGRPAYQRMVNPGRIQSIGEYIKKGGYFPTNLLVNFTEGCRFDQISNKDNTDPNIKFGWLYLPNKYKSAWVIDGQHRLYGFSHLETEQDDSSLFVVAFEKMDTRTEAELFVTINHKQKSVPKNVLVELQADLRWGSEDARERITAIASALGKALKTDAQTPFFQRIQNAGVQAQGNQPLTMPEVVNGLVRSGLLGKPGKTILSGPLSGATDDETLLRARKVVSTFFTHVRESNVSRWELGKLGFVATNPGVRAGLLLIADILRYLQSKDAKFEPREEKPDAISQRLHEVAKPLFAFLKVATDSQIEERFSKKFGEGGVRDYFYNLCTIIHEKNSSFGSQEFLEHLAKRKDIRITETSDDILDLEKAVRDSVIAVLKKHYGVKEMKSQEKAYWELGIQNEEIKERAFKAQMTAPAGKKLPKENYLSLIDLMKVIRQPSNWPLFKEIFDIPQADDPKNKQYHLDWIERLNELRKIAAHRSEDRAYEEEDYDFVGWVKRELYERLEIADVLESKS